jgi:pilus assembly protein Flp/PilA
MGLAAGSRRLFDAARRSAAHSDVARSALSFVVDQKGATAIEYAMIAAFLSIVIITAVNQLGQNINNSFFNQIAQNLP